MKRQLITLYALLGLTAAVAAFAVVSVVIQQHHQNDALHSIMCRAESVSRSSKLISPAERLRAVRFYQRALADAHLAPCNR